MNTMLWNRFRPFLNAIPCLVLVLLSSFPSYAQNEDPTQPILVDEFGRLSHCDHLSRFDSFFAELSQNPDHHGYIINYKPSNELPGQKDENFREKFVRHHMAFRQFDASRITFIQGGYKEDFRTQLYRVPPGATAPKPSDTLPEPTIDEHKTFLYDRTSLGTYGSGYEMDAGGSVLDEFVLESVKAREAAEQAAQEAEWEAEQNAAKSDEVPQPDDQTVAEEDSSEAANTDEEEYVAEPLSEEEILAERFQWTEVSLAKFLSSRKKSAGVLLFYADDQRYDIAKLRTYVEEGRDRLAEKGGVKADRIRVEFGGYRDSPEVEFWFVPKKGKPPVPTPEERKPDDPPHHH